MRKVDLNTKITLKGVLKTEKFLKTMLITGNIYFIINVILVTFSSFILGNLVFSSFSFLPFVATLLFLIISLFLVSKFRNIKINNKMILNELKKIKKYLINSNLEFITLKDYFNNVVKKNVN